MAENPMSSISLEAGELGMLNPEQRERLSKLLDDYLKELESGGRPTQESYLSANPDLAEPLRIYLDKLEELYGISAGFQRQGSRAESFDEGLSLHTGELSPEQELGDFRLIREIGRGGMGIVYEAYQVSLNRKVAVKLLPFASLLNAKQIARFKNEANAAAQLQHPGIVSIFSIGVEKGIHYYAMQLIEGKPLDQVMGELHGTSEAEENSVRVKLNAGHVLPFPRSLEGEWNKERVAAQWGWIACVGIQAAEALEAAHLEGIIHRDIKPSNLLIDATGKLWITDFGLARFQREATLTKSGDVLGTMQYMSPEQASGRGEAVDQRTDLYALGATLYELSTGRPAIESGDAATMLRRIANETPTPLRFAASGIPESLATIIEKLMAKDRDERYTTARETADDLRRFLRGQPILARPPGLSQRLWKWGQLHRRAVAVSAAVAALMAIGLVISVFSVNQQKQVAQRNFLRAERYFRNAHQAVDQFGMRVADQLEGLPGAESLRQSILLDTLNYYQKFAKEAEARREIDFDLATTYSKMAVLYDQSGQTQQSLEHFERADSLWQQLVSSEPNVLGHQRQLAVNQNNWGLVLARAGNQQRAEELYRKALARQSSLVALRSDGGIVRELALTHNNLGLLLGSKGDRDAAEVELKKALKLQEEFQRSQPDDPEIGREIAGTYNNLSSLLETGPAQPVVELLQQSIDWQLRSRSGSNPLLYARQLALTYNNLGAAQARAGSTQQAMEAYQRGIELHQQLVLTAPAVAIHSSDLATSLNNLGMLKHSVGDLKGAIEAYRQAVSAQEPLLQTLTDDAASHSALGGIYNNLAEAYGAMGNQGETESAFQRAIALQQEAIRWAPQVTRYQEFLGKHFFNYAKWLRNVGRAEEGMKVTFQRAELFQKDINRAPSVIQELVVGYQSCQNLAGNSHGLGSIRDQCRRIMNEFRRLGYRPVEELLAQEPFQN